MSAETSDSDSPIQRFLRQPKREVQEAPLPPPGGTVVAEALAAQLGSDAVTLGTGKVDMRRLSNVNSKQLMPLLYFMNRGKKVRFWKEFVDNFLSPVRSWILPARYYRNPT